MIAWGVAGSGRWWSCSGTAGRRTDRPVCRAPRTGLSPPATPRPSSSPVQRPATVIAGAAEICSIFRSNLRKRCACYVSRSPHGSWRRRVGGVRRLRRRGNLLVRWRRGNLLVAVGHRGPARRGGRHGWRGQSAGWRNWRMYACLVDVSTMIARGSPLDTSGECHCRTSYVGWRMERLSLVCTGRGRFQAGQGGGTVRRSHRSTLGPPARITKPG